MAKKKLTIDINIKAVPIETARTLRTIAENKGITRHELIMQILNDRAISYNTKQQSLFNSDKIK